VNLAPIRSAFLEISEAQTNNKVTDSAKNRTLRSLLCDDYLDVNKLDDGKDSDVDDDDIKLQGS